MMFFNKIHKKFIAVIIVVLLVSLGLAAIISDYYLTNALTEFAKDELKSKTEINADEISTFFDEKVKLSKALAKEPHIVELNTIQANGLRGPNIVEKEGGIRIQNYIKNYEDSDQQPVMDFLKSVRLTWVEIFENVWTGDVYGQQTSDSLDGVSMGLSVAKIGGQSYLDALAGRDYSIMPVIWAPNPGVETLKISVLMTPIRAKEGGVVGVFGLPMFITDFVSEITQKTIGNGFNILIDNRGHLLGFADEKYSSRRNTNYEDITLDTYLLSEVEGEFGTGWAALSDKMLGGDSGFTEAYGKNGEKYIIYYTPVKAKGDYIAKGSGQGWSIASAISEAELLAQAKEMRNSIYILIALTIIIGAIIAYIVAKRITKPIVKLKEAANKMNEGDLDVKIEVTSDDEVGELAASMEALVSGFKSIKGK